jgi:hypothetical protein
VNLFLLWLVFGFLGVPHIRVKLFDSTEGQRFLSDRRVRVHQNCACSGGLCGYLKLQVQVHYVEDQVQLVEVDLEFKEGEGLSRYPHPKLVFEVLGNVWVLNTADVVHCFQHEDVLWVLPPEVFLVRLEKGYRFLLYFAALDHVQK